MRSEKEKRPALAGLLIVFDSILPASDSILLAFDSIVLAFDSERAAFDSICLLNSILGRLPSG